MVADTLVAFQLDTEAHVTGGIQVFLQILCYSLCVHKEPERGRRDTHRERDSETERETERGKEKKRERMRERKRKI